MTEDTGKRKEDNEAQGVVESARVNVEEMVMGQASDEAIEEVKRRGDNDGLTAVEEGVQDSAEQTPVKRHATERYQN